MSVLKIKNCLLRERNLDRRRFAKGGVNVAMRLKAAKQTLEALKDHFGQDSAAYKTQAKLVFDLGRERDAKDLLGRLKKKREQILGGLADGKKA